MPRKHPTPEGPSTLVLEQLAEMVKAAATGKTTTSVAVDAKVNAPATMPAETLYDICGRKRSPATLRSFRLGVKPKNAGRKYPATPPTEEEVMRLLDACKNNPAGRRLRALIVIQWRSGLRVSEALDLNRNDVNEHDGTVFVACGKGGRARLVGMDQWAFDEIRPWLTDRYDRYPDGPVLCVVQGPTKGARWSSSAARTAMAQTATLAGVERRVRPHQLRHAHAVGMAREGVGLHIIQRQLGHSSLATTATYMAGISNEEVVHTIASRPAPGTAVVS